MLPSIQHFQVGLHTQILSVYDNAHLVTAHLLIRRLVAESDRQQYSNGHCSSHGSTQRHMSMFSGWGRDSAAIDQQQGEGSQGVLESGDTSSSGSEAVEAASQAATQLFDPATILEAAAAAEEAALATAYDEAWMFTKGLHALLHFVHNSSGLPW